MNMDNYDECPICLVAHPLLITPCNHRVCQTCLERVLLGTQQSLPSIESRIGEESIASDEELEDFIVSNNPTCGKCPFCRKCISLFDVKIERGKGREAEFLYEKRNDLWRTALSGMSFQDGTKSIILKFPNNDHDEPNAVISIDPDKHLNISFERGCFFHKKTNTFHGSLDLKDGPMKIQEKWDFVMQFASDFRFVTHGVIVKRPVESISDEPSNVISRYPLAGDWVVRWQRLDQRGVDRNSLDAARLTVYGNSFYFQGFMYHINLGDDEEEGRVHFMWPSYLGSYKQVAESGIDLRSNPHGPGVGETIVWTTSNPNFFRIFWTRETKESSCPPVRVQRLGAGGTTFVKMQQKRQIERPIYNPETLWGNVFVQGMTVGYASYHFVSPDGEGEYGAYISYEHFKCSYWPPLDDGSPVPSRVPFVNISYDSSTRTFRGHIPWYDRYGTSWQGCTSWEYEMTFDSEFLCIVSGEVKNIRNILNQQPTEAYCYGQELNYINCALPEKIRRESSETDRFIMRMRERLLHENAPQRTLVYIMQASIRVLEHDEDIFDYNV